MYAATGIRCLVIIWRKLILQLTDEMQWWWGWYSNRTESKTTPSSVRIWTLKLNHAESWVMYRGQWGLLGAVLVVKSDASRREGPAIPLLHTPRVYQFFTELPSDVIVTYRSWDSFTISDDSFSIILLSPITCTGSRGHPRMKLAFFITLSSLFLPAAEMLLLRQTTS